MQCVWLGIVKAGKNEKVGEEKTLDSCKAIDNYAFLDDRSKDRRRENMKKLKFKVMRMIKSD